MATEEMTEYVDACDKCGTTSGELIVLPWYEEQVREFVDVDLSNRDARLCPPCYGKRQGAAQDFLDNYPYCEGCGERHAGEPCDTEEELEDA